MGDHSDGGKGGCVCLCSSVEGVEVCVCVCCARGVVGWKLMLN